jgi:hypothetical protein
VDEIDISGLGPISETEIITDLDGIDVAAAGADLLDHHNMAGTI